MKAIGQLIRSGLRAWIPVAKLAAVGILLINAVVYARRWTFKPPANAKTLVELSRAGEPVQRLVRVEHDGRTRYLWLGATRWSALPSGPACFVFDARGNLEEYTATTGDKELGGLCDAAWAEPGLSVQQAIASTGQQ